MHYKLYFRDREGRIGDRIDLVCARDDHAVDRARALADLRPMELWRGPTLIERFPPAVDRSSRAAAGRERRTRWRGPG